VISSEEALRRGLTAIAGKDIVSGNAERYLGFQTVGADRVNVSVGIYGAMYDRHELYALLCEVTRVLRTSIGAREPPRDLADNLEGCGSAAGYGNSSGRGLGFGWARGHGSYFGRGSGRGLPAATFGAGGATR